MRRACVAIAIVLAHVAPVSAGPDSIAGVVVDHATGQPIAGATLSGGVTTDEVGHFSLPAGDRVVVVTAAGYTTRTIDVASLPRTDARIDLDPSQEVIEIHAKAPPTTRPLSYDLTADDVKLVPGAGNDLLRAASVLPGAARIPYSFGGLVLRGTSPSDTAVYLDGIEVPIAFHFGGLTSFYPGDMLSSLSLTPGGFDVAYGRAEGGIVSLATREPRTDKWREGGEAGLLEAGAFAEGPIAGGGIIVGVRHSYFDLVARPFVDADIPLPSYWDAQLRGSFGDPAGWGRISPMVFTSIDIVENQGTGAVGGTEKVRIDSMFVRAAAPYLKQWGPLALHVVPWLGTDRLSYLDIENADEETFERPVYPGGLRADLVRDTTWGHVSGGFDGEGGYLSHTQVGLTGEGQGPQQADGSATLTWADLALWGETRVKLGGDRLAVKPGVRVEHYGLTDEWVIDPRLNIVQKLTDALTLRQALGRFHQPPTPADIDPENGNPKLKSSYFDQASLGVDAQLSDSTSASLTGFAEYGQRLGVEVPNPSMPANNYEPDLGGLGPTFELLLEKQLGFSIYRENVGRARSYGGELLVKYTAGRWFGLLAYTLSKSERTDGPTLPPGWRPFELDQRHNVNLAGSVALGAWRLGARMQIVSGNPYSPTVFVDNVPVQKPWAGQLPTFFQLDLRADRRWQRRSGDIDLYFDIQNATNYGNVEGREYDSSAGRDVDVPGLPIVPFIGVQFIPK
ncbi:MAG TPA: TonB-dependent receptor [Kofleriaceae bacterium]|nr:TonB-dependent receptor [Kofleriaceae bacterium]